MHTHLEAVYVIKFVPIFQYEHDNRKNKLIVSFKKNNRCRTSRWVAISSIVLVFCFPCLGQYVGFLPIISKI